jgi:ribosomal protein S18 acetylase RimI-like enzyme
MVAIKKATHEDLSKILRLQKLAYLSEAKLLNNYSIQPLTQTLEELEKEFSKSIILKIEDESANEIIGSVRSYEENDRVYVGKLMVHPDYQNRGIGTKLLKTIETYYTNKTFELFTSNKSEKNILLYKKNGYNEYKRNRVSENLELIFMEKINAQ